MNSLLAEQAAACGPNQMRTRAMTLVEMLVAMAIFSMVVLALTYAHMFGQRQDQLVGSKLGASDQSRKGFNLLARDIRSAKIWQMGNGSDTSFTPIPNGTGQEGTALQIHLTTDTNNYIRYYFDTDNSELRRTQGNQSGSIVIAQHLTNNMSFRAEDYRGMLQTDLSHKGVIHVALEFCQYQYPMTKVGPGYYYDYYKLEFRITPHVPDGP